MDENTTLPKPEDQFAEAVQGAATFIGIDPKKPWLSRSFLAALLGSVLGLAAILGYSVDPQKLEAVLTMLIMAMGIFRSESLDWSWLKRRS